jgi:PEP-CTERM motif
LLCPLRWVNPRCNVSAGHLDPAFRHGFEAFYSECIVEVIPEPGTFGTLLAGLGLVGLLAARRAGGRGG